MYSSRHFRDFIAFSILIMHSSFSLLTLGVLFLCIGLVSNSLLETCLLLWFKDPLGFFNVDNFIICGWWKFCFSPSNYYASFSCFAAFARMSGTSLDRNADRGLLWLGMFLGSIFINLVLILIYCFFSK